MRTLRGEGWTWRAIAEALGRSYGATRVRAHLEGLSGIVPRQVRQKVLGAPLD